MVPETALDHGEVVLEARAVAAALRTRSEFADVSKHQSREIVPTKYSQRAKARRSICLNPISKTRTPTPEYMPHLRIECRTRKSGRLMRQGC